MKLRYAHPGVFVGTGTLIFCPDSALIFGNFSAIRHSSATVRSTVLLFGATLRVHSNGRRALVAIRAVCLWHMCFTKIPYYVRHSTSQAAWASVFRPWRRRVQTFAWGSKGTLAFSLGPPLFIENWPPFGATWPTRKSYGLVEQVNSQKKCCFECPRLVCLAL